MPLLPEFFIIRTMPENRKAVSTFLLMILQKTSGCKPVGAFFRNFIRNLSGALLRLILPAPRPGLQSIPAVIHNDFRKISDTVHNRFIDITVSGVYDRKR